MFLQYFILNFSLFTLFLQVESELYNLNENVARVVETITSSGLHIHFIIELDNIENFYISEIVPQQQIPYTIHNIYPKKVPFAICYISDKFICRNLTNFRPFPIFNIKSTFNSYSSIIIIVLPKFENLPSRSINEREFNLDKNYDFDATSVTQKLLCFNYIVNVEKITVQIVLKTQVTIFQFGRKVPKSQDEFHSIVGENRPKYEQESYLDYIVTGFANYYLINIDFEKANLVSIDFLCMYCEIDIVAIPINIEKMSHNNINDFLLKNYLNKVIYYHDNGAPILNEILNYAGVLKELYCNNSKNVTFKKFPNFYKRWYGKLQIKEENSLRKYFQNHEELVWGKKFTLFSQLLTTKTLKYGFMTGWSKSQYSFAMYYKPFELSLWIWFLCFVGLLAFLKTICFDKKLGFANIIASFISNILILLAPIFEDSVEIPKKIYNSSGFKLVIGLWMLEACIFTNLYSSSLISDLLSPMPSESLHSLKDFISKSEKNARFPFLDNEKEQNISFGKLLDEMWKIKDTNKMYGFETISGEQDKFHFDFNIEHVTPQLKDQYYPEFGRYYISLITPSIGINEDKILIPKKLAVKIAFLLISETNKEIKRTSYKFLREPFYYLGPFVFDSLLLMKLISTRESKTFIAPIQSINHINDKYKTEVFPNEYKNPLYNSLIEEKLVKNEEFVYIDKVEKISQEYEYISKSYPKQNIFKKSFGDLINDNIAWSFVNTKNTILLKYFQWFYETGCYNYYIRNNTGINYSERRKYTNIIKKLMNLDHEAKKSLGFSTSFNTFFYIWLITILFAVFCSIFEFINEYGSTFFNLLSINICLFWFKVKYSYNQFNL